MNENQSCPFFLVSTLALRFIFTQSTIGTCIVNKTLQEIILLVEILLLFACGCMGVEFGFSTACLIKTSQDIYMQLIPCPQDLMQVRMRDLSADTTGTFWLVGAGSKGNKTYLSRLLTISRSTQHQHTTILSVWRQMTVQSDNINKMVQVLKLQSTLIQALTEPCMLSLMLRQVVQFTLKRKKSKHVRPNERQTR